MERIISSVKNTFAIPFSPFSSRRRKFGVNSADLTISEDLDECESSSTYNMKASSRKRKEVEKTSPITPNLVSSTIISADNRVNGAETHPKKKIKFMSTVGENPEFEETVSVSQQSLLLCQIPSDLLRYALSYISNTDDRFSLQVTCRQFRLISNSPEFLKTLCLQGNPETGSRCVLLKSNSPEEAIDSLIEFAKCENLEAMYMIGMIKAYCHDGIRNGVSILRCAARLGCAKSSYALGLILRDSSREESEHHLLNATEQKHLPAWQELLPAPEIKERFGDLDASTLKSYLDPICLNRFLRRHYMHSSQVRNIQTSHCWNPLCGRWAFKATPVNNTQPRLNLVSPPPPSPMASHIEASLEALIRKSTHPSSSSHVPDIYCEEVESKPWKVSRMKMCSSCRRAKYCSKLCQVYDWRSGRHKMECVHLSM